MDRQIRDHHKVSVKIDQTLLHAAVSTYHNPSGNREGSVKPRCAQHTSVLLCIQLHIMTCRNHLRILLDLEARRIAVGRYHLEIMHFPLRDPEGDERRSISHHIIVSALLQLPFFIFI